ncbi:right-handed parallel beta-helix repeat-containing protein [Haladaptatus sp. NG-SE-30]
MVPTPFRQSLTRWVVVVLTLGVLLAATSLMIHHPSTDGLTQDEPQPVSHCTVISHEGTYKLTQDIQGGKLSDSCIRVNESHVTLQGRGHTLRGNGATDSTAISVSHPRGVTDVTVRSVKTTGWNRGVHVANGSDITIQNTDAWKNAEGITVWNSTHVAITEVRLTNNLFGLVVDRSSHQLSVSTAHIEHNVAGNVSWGDYRSGSNGTTATTKPGSRGRYSVSSSG